MVRRDELGEADVLRLVHSKATSLTRTDNPRVTKRCNATGGPAVDAIDQTYA
jgi:hypothetical protein